MTRLALVIGEVYDEQDFIPTDDDYGANFEPDSYTFCQPSNRSGPALDIANLLLKTCATLVRNSGIYDPDLSVCFDGFSRLNGAEDWLPEFTPV